MVASMRQRSFVLALSLAGVVQSLSCGEGVVSVTNQSYQPRIVVSGLLIAGHPVEDIHVSRNFRLDENLNETPIFLTEAAVLLIDEDEAANYPLTFVDSPSFEKRGFAWRDDTPLAIRAGGTYSLEVRATVEGQELFTRATTTVPGAGFEIVDLTPERTEYRARDGAGNVIMPEVTIERSPGTTFYLLTAVPLDMSVDTFIYDNPFSDEDPRKIDLFDFNYEFEWIQNTPVGAGQSKMGLFWWDVWFYGRHEIVIYAVDANWAHFLQTFEEVQELDGNFHEPKFEFEGDGLGYFGSAIPDTTHIEILRSD
jgi:hypothetical protein